MAKKSKKIPALELQGFEDIDFNKEPDIQAAKKIIQTQKVENKEVKESVVAKATAEPLPIEEKEAIEPTVPKVVRVVKEPAKEIYNAPAERTVAKATPSNRKKASAPTSVPKGTVAPMNKKRASFNIDEDLHRALKEYSFFQEIDMVEYIFEELVKPDLKKKGYYPPKRRRR